MPERLVAVLHTVGSLHPNSGVTPFIRDSLKFRGDQGLPTACLYFIQQTAEAQDQATQQLHPIIKPPGPWQQYRAFKRATRELVRQWRQQGHHVVIHDHGLWLPSNLASSAAAGQTGCPYIVSPHGMLQPVALSHAGLKKRLAWQLYEHRRLRQACWLHATAPIEAQAIENSMPTARVVQVRLGMETPPRPALPGGRESEALYLGRLHPLKGIDMLLQAWARVRPPGWRLRLVGPCETSYLESLKALINQQGLSTTVTLDGPLYGADKTQAFQRAALFVLPSFSENFGMVVCEALSHGLPVITTDSTPWTDIPERGCGWIAHPTADDIGRCLHAATAMPLEELGRMGLAGWSWMRDNFDLHVVMRDMERHYRGLFDA